MKLWSTTKRKISRSCH